MNHETFYKIGDPCTAAGPSGGTCPSDTRSEDFVAQTFEQVLVSAKEAASLWRDRGFLVQVPVCLGKRVSELWEDGYGTGRSAG